MLKIGITGGMGSGKTTVCKIFQCLNIPIYDADHEAKNLYNTDLQLREEVIQIFGADVFTNDLLNHSLLAAKIFSINVGSTSSSSRNAVCRAATAPAE